MSLKKFSLTVANSGVLTPQLISFFINSFWVQIFKPINIRNNNHLLMIIKVVFASDTAEGDGQTVSGYRSLTTVKRVNYEDRKLYIDYVINRLGILADSYSVQPISEIFIEYIEQQGPASNSGENLQEAEYTVQSHTYNNYQLPLTMNPYDYGEVKSISDIPNGHRYIVQNKSFIFQIDQIDGPGDGTLINHVSILTADITYTDYTLEGSSFAAAGVFKREIGTFKNGKESLVRYTYYIEENKKIIVKTKQLKAKQFRAVPLDKEIASNDCFMTVDIETVLINNVQVPYLIYGYTVSANGAKNTIHSYSDVNPHTYSQDKIDALFNDFITKLLTNPNFANVQYVYAHNLSGFDGILFLNHLLKYENATTKPLIFNSKLMSIKFAHTTRVSYLSGSC